MPNFVVAPESPPVAGNTVFTEDGSASNPFRDIGSCVPVANDVLTISGTTSTAPIQDEHETVVDQTIKGDTKQYVSSALDLTEGAIYERKEYSNFGQSVGIFTAAGTVIDNTTDNVLGTTCQEIASGSRLTNGGANAIRMIPNTKFRFRVVGKATVDKLSWRMKNAVSGLYLNPATSVWDAGATFIDLISNTTTHEEYVSDWYDAHTVEATVEMTIGTAGGDVGVMQRFIFEQMNVWTVHDAPNNIYKLSVPSHASGTDIVTLLKDNTAIDFSTPEVATNVTKAASLGAIAKGEFFHSYVNGLTADEGILYYRLLDSEPDVTSLYFKGIRRNTVCIKPTANSVTLSNIALSGAARGIRTENAADVIGYDIDIANCHYDFVHNAGSGDCNIIGGIFDQCIGASGEHGDGLLSSSSGLIELTGVAVSNCGDEVFQVTLNGRIILNNCFGEGSQRFEADAAIISLEGASGDTGSIVVNGGCFRTNAGENSQIIREGAAVGHAGALTINGAILINNGLGATYVSSNGAATLTSANNKHGGDGAASGTIGALTSTLITPSDHFDNWDSGNPVVKADSSLLGTASKYWTGANPIGIDGEPFSDFDTDYGCIQSKLNPFHPVNL